MRIRRKDDVFGVLLETTEQLTRRIGQYMTGKFLDDLGKRIIAKAKANAPERTGALKRSIKIVRRTERLNARLMSGRLSRRQVTRQISVATGVGLRPDYGAVVELGSENYYSIVPKARKFLRFEHSKIPGTIVFTKRVNHPPQKAQPYLIPAFNEEINSLNPRISRYLDREILSFTRKAFKQKS